MCISARFAGTAFVIVSAIACNLVLAVSPAAAVADIATRIDTAANPPRTIEDPVGSSAVASPHMTPVVMAAIDEDGPLAEFEAAVSIADGVFSVYHGYVLTYTIGVASSGAEAVVRLVDDFPSVLSGCNWTCQSFLGGSCPTPASGSGDIDIELGLPARTGQPAEFVRITAVCTIAQSAPFGVFSNAAQLLVSPPFVDTNASNNVATDQNQIMETADISLTVSDGRQYVRVGDFLDYVIEVQNAGPDDVHAFVSDVLPDGLESGSWECLDASPGATCSSGSGLHLVDPVFLPAGGHIAYVYSATVGTGPHTQSIANTAVAFGHLELIDPPFNNIATDSPPDIVVLFRADFDPD